MEQSKEVFTNSLRTKIRLFTKGDMVFFDRDELSAYVARLSSLVDQAYEQGECDLEVHKNTIMLIELAAFSYKIPTEA